MTVQYCIPISEKYDWDGEFGMYNAFPFPFPFTKDGEYIHPFDEAGNEIPEEVIRARPDFGEYRFNIFRLGRLEVVPAFDRAACIKMIGARKFARAEFKDQIQAWRAEGLTPDDVWQKLDTLNGWITPEYAGLGASVEVATGQRQEGG